MADESQNGAKTINDKIDALKRGDLSANERGDVLREIRGLVDMRRGSIDEARACVDALDQGAADVKEEDLAVDRDEAVQKLRAAQQALDAGLEAGDVDRLGELLREEARWSAVCAAHLKQDAQIVERDLSDLSATTGAAG